MEMSAETTCSFEECCLLAVWIEMYAEETCCFEECGLVDWLEMSAEKTCNFEECGLSGWKCLQRQHVVLKTAGLLTVWKCLQRQHVVLQSAGFRFVYRVVWALHPTCKFIFTNLLRSSSCRINREMHSHPLRILKVQKNTQLSYYAGNDREVLAGAESSSCDTRQPWQLCLP
jgi:hypothetical protein